MRSFTAQRPVPRYRWFILSGEGKEGQDLESHKGKLAVISIALGRRLTALSDNRLP